MEDRSIQPIPDDPNLASLGIAPSGVQRLLGGIADRVNATRSPKTLQQIVAIHMTVEPTPALIMAKVVDDADGLYSRGPRKNIGDDDVKGNFRAQTSQAHRQEQTG
jgi:hypothetical protein